MPSPSSTELRAKLKQLDAIRLAHDWTWNELSASMAAAHAEISPRTLHYLIKRAGANAKPIDRTVHKIGVYLEHVREMARRQRVRKANAAANPESANGRGV